MTILFDSARSSKPLGLGLAVDAPAPPAWMTAVTEALISLGYDTAAGRAEAVAWFGAHGTLRGCPQVEQDDVPAIDAVFGLFHPESPAADATRARLEADAEMQAGGDVEGPAESWPTWTDAHRYEPTPEDRIWWARQQDARERGRGFDRRAAESRTLESLERGLLIPADVAEGLMATSLVGHDARAVRPGPGRPPQPPEARR
jgi:hypothetical protein